MNVEPIDRAEEKKLLEDWFNSVEFDNPSAGIPAMKDEDDDEESRMTLTYEERDARGIEAWFAAAPGAVIPEAAEDEASFAHENMRAWDHVDPSKLRGLSKVEAQGHMVTMARLLRHSPGGKPHNQKDHGRRGPGGKGKGIKRIVSDIYKGKKTNAQQSQVKELMTILKAGPSTNLLGVLDIDGQPCCFGTVGKGALPRSEMPQLPTTVEGLQPFVNALRDRGIKATLEEVDPSTLRASQNQLDGKKVGKLNGFMTPPGGWQKGGALIASNDDHVGDGHHRWAAAAAVSAAGDPILVTVLRVDMPISELLPLMQEFSGQRFGLGEG